LQAAAGAPLAQKSRQGLGLDPKELHVNLIDVQRDNRQAFGQTRGQQATPAGKANGRLQVTGFQTANELASQGCVGDGTQARVDGQDQFALRFQMAQVQLHQVIGQLPGAIDLAGLGIDQVQFFSEILLGVQRHRETHRQGAGTVQLHFRDIHHVQLTTGIALSQHLGVLHRLGGLGGGCRLGRLGLGGRRGITSTQQRQRAGQEQSFVKHGVLIVVAVKGQLYNSVALTADALVVKDHFPRA